MQQCWLKWAVPQGTADFMLPPGRKTADGYRHQSWARCQRKKHGPSTQSMMVIGLTALWAAMEAW